MQAELLLFRADQLSGPKQAERQHGPAIMTFYKGNVELHGYSASYY